jgi:MFS family permease
MTLTPVATSRRGWSLLPSDATSDAGILIAARGVRAFGDGFVSVLLPVYLTELGFSSIRIGAISTATLVGSAALTLLVGLFAFRLQRRRLLIAATLLMIATGVGFTVVHAFWPLMLVALVGTLNPSAGDVSVFLPLEQTLIPQTVSDRQRTSLFARYGLIASLIGAVGALFASVPGIISDHSAVSLRHLLQATFLLYGLLAVVALLLYRRLSPAVEREAHAVATPLKESKRIVYTLAALFSLDSLGDGFVVQSLLALWLFNRFDLSVTTAATIFFWSGVFSALSYLVAVRLADRFGLVKTMVFTHLPAQIALILTPFMPTLWLAIVLLLIRAMLSQMDVPTRNSYVMAIVTPAERTAAASVTSVPRSLASASTPLLSGYLLGVSVFGWPLVICGVLKSTYDLLTLALFSKVKPPEEVERRSGAGRSEPHGG